MTTNPDNALDDFVNTTTTAVADLRGERADLLEALTQARWLLRFTTQGMTDDQARLRSTVSELSLGGIIKHVATTEQGWTDFILRGTEAMPGDSPEARFEFMSTFTMGPDETLAGLLERYAEVAARTDELIATLPDLDVAHPLPAAPWFPPGATRSARRVLHGIIAETAQHAGHADIIRETIDGQKSMG